FEAADIVAQVRTLGANLEAGTADLALMREGQMVLGLSDPLSKTDAAQKLAEQGVTLVGMELIPRITRAQSMDALSSMATVAGYRAVLLAANHLPKLFPMMMTAAGTLAATKAFVIGAGVAGLQACATAKRLGAVVKAYDVRAAVKDQVISVGAKFVELQVEAGDAEDKGGYAKALGEDFYRRQRELMTEVVAESDVVITTAAIPGKKSPVLVTADMVEKMPPGAVIVDLAAERGGNCELTKADEVVNVNGVTILGPTNIVTGAPFHASQMYGKNVVTLLGHLIKDGQLELDMSDEITQGVVMTKDKEVVHPKVREILGLSELAKPAEEVKA
ncbi:MAG: NAD(P) transhydrogenase subunit alpha, partial [Myxococcota bacterium]